MTDSEIWQDTAGYEDLYQISTKGRIRSKIEKTRIIDKEDRIMRQKMDDKGYMRVNLHKDGKCRAELVSRLVASTFIPNPENLPHVGHDDDDKINNDVTNLYWTDYPENNRHNGKLDRLHSSHNAKIDIIKQKISQRIKGVSINGSEEIFFNSMTEAQRHGFDEGKISMCVNGKRTKHKGYRWERID